MRFLQKLFPKNSQPDELQEIKTREKQHDDKMWAGGDYPKSDEAKLTGKMIYRDKKEYVMNHPTDYLIVGAHYHKHLWFAIDELPEDEQEIFILTGKGLCLEDNGKYSEAIKYYQRAILLNNIVCADDIQYLIKSNGPGDYIYAPALKVRIRVCEKNKLN